MHKHQNERRSHFCFFFYLSRRIFSLTLIHTQPHTHITSHITIIVLVHDLLQRHCILPSTHTYTTNSTHIVTLPYILQLPSLLALVHRIIFSLPSLLLLFFLGGAYIDKLRALVFYVFRSIIQLLQSTLLGNKRGGMVFDL